MIDTQQISRDVLTEKYCKNGETTVDDVYRRVAKGVAKAEVPEKQQEWEDTFYKNMQEGAIGAGRIMSAAGSDIQATLINCFSGETKALTSEGYKELKDLVDKTTKVFSIDGWRDATFKNFGKQKLYKITFAGNRIHYATLNHRWLSTGEIPMITKAEDLKETTTKDLVGHYIPAVGHIPELNVDISTNYLKRLGFIKVLSVEDTDREEDVYCAVEPVTQTFTIEGNIITRNCFVEPIGDSIKDIDEEGNPGIYTALLESAETMKRGGGVGYNFSHIRPKNAFVKSVGSFSSGPCSYIDIFNTSCATIESAGCFHGDTLISTTEGLVKISEIVNSPDNVEWYVNTHLGPRKVTTKFKNGQREVWRVITGRGYSTRVTMEHKFAVIDGNNDIKLKTLFDISNRREYDNICLLAVDNEVELLTGDDEKEAYIQGAFLSVGRWTGDDENEDIRGIVFNESMFCSNAIELLHDYANELGFDPIIRVEPGASKMTLSLNNSIIMQSWYDLGIRLTDKRIPNHILHNTPSVQAAFIAGLFDMIALTDKKNNIYFKSYEYNFIKDIQVLLLHLGVRSLCSIDKDEDDITFYNLSIKGRNARNRYANVIGLYSLVAFGDGSDISESTNLITDKVVGLIKEGDYETYDLEVDETHMLSGDGFYTSNSRRGAQMGILDINHPDILEFVKAKRTPGRWNNFNVSVMVTDEFMLAKNGNKPFQLIHEAKPSDMLINNGAFQREDGMWVYETIDANVLWDTIMQSNYDYAEPGILFRDTINNDNNLRYVERIDATNPCVTIDTWVMTTDGPRQVRDLIDKPYKAVVDGVSYLSKTGFFFTGKKQIFKVKTTDGYTLKLTDNHLLFKLAGKFEGKNVFAETAVSDLKPIDLLRLNDHKKSLNWDGYGCVNDGFLLGSYLLKSPITLKTDINKVHVILEDLHIDPNDTTAISKVEKTSRQFHIGFLNAVFDSYSTVSITNNELTIKLKYNDYSILETVQRMLLRLGIVCTRRNTDITIVNYNIVRFYTEVGFTDESKDAVINSYIKQNKDTIKKETFVSAIESILPQSTEELVYDTTVEDIHVFDANGFHAHNCSEQPLPPYGCCDLGPINLTKFVKNPFTPEAHFDYEKFKSAVTIQVRFLDNVLDVTLWPLEQQRKEAMNKRRIGVGYTGLGNVLAMLGLHYDSEAGRLTAKTIAKTMRDSAYKASVELAKERGPFPLFNKDKYLTDTFASRLPDYIKDEIKKYGIRNSHLLSIAPTGTVSLAFCDNASNGIEPPYSLAYIRKKRENDGTMKPYPVIDYGFRVWLETQESKEAEQILDAVCNYRDHILVGEDKKKVLIKELLPEALVTALELSVDGHLQMLKVTQPYICTAISKTVNIPVDYPFEDFKTIYDKAWEYKLKGVATYRPNDILGSVLSVPMETKKEEVKLVTGNIKEDKMEEAIDRADPKDLDPFTVAYPRRPLGDFPSITRKIVYTGATGDVSLFLTVSFITTFGHKGNDTLIVDRPLEIFIVVPPDDVPVEWVTAYAKNLSLIARSSLPLLVKALQDGRSIKSDKGQIRYGWFDKEDGTRVPRFHSSEVGVIAYAIQELLHSKEILDEEGNLLPINDRNIVKVINTGLPKDSTEEQIVPTEPKQSNGNSVIRTNKVCKHCGASAVIKRDGCSFCTNCNTPGDCG